VHNVYTRTDTFAWLVEEAFARLGELGREADAGASRDAAPKRGTKQKPPSDVGGPCVRASDCAAGICVTDGDRSYCSRPCGPGDRCPAQFHCTAKPDAGARASACVRVR
jgi:hypothetical protein